MKKKEARKAARSYLPKSLREQGWWACACVRRRKGKMTQIKLNSPKVLRCFVCGACNPKEPLANQLPLVA